MRRLRPVMSWEPEEGDLCSREPPRVGLGWMARLLGHTQDCIKAAAKAGRLPGEQVDGQWQFDPVAVRTYIFKL